MSDLILLSTQDRVAVLTMNTAENRHNPAFVSAFHQRLDEIEANKALSAVVLTSSSDKNWSLGIDLEWMSQPQLTAEQNGEFMLSVTALFKRLLCFPMPFIAAMNGHAFGNGSVLACACDFRFMKRDKGFFCFPEVDVLVPFFPSMFPMIHKAIPPTFFNRLAMTGERVGADQLAQHQVIEAAYDDADSLHEGVMAFAAQFNKNRWIYGQNKTQMNQAILTKMAEEDPAFVARVSPLLLQGLRAKR